jgi:hypothetical protein
MVRFALLHDINNPQHNKYIDANDFDAVEDFGSGSVIRLKSSDMPVAVHETPDEVKRIVQETLNS